MSPFTERREFHKGYDISSRKGTPILATADGVVTFAGKKGLLGNTVVIDHGHGLVTRYGHCDKFLKKRGDKVNRWEPIALMGNTGRSTGPHVHYEVHLNGMPVNPEKYMLN
jgi:murein DD-endopeptidase MepM/ murein hydrolase activator NlpD